MPLAPTFQPTFCRKWLCKFVEWEPNMSWNMHLINVNVHLWSHRPHANAQFYQPARNMLVITCSKLFCGLSFCFVQCRQSFSLHGMLCFGSNKPFMTWPKRRRSNAQIKRYFNLCRRDWGRIEYMYFVRFFLDSLFKHDANRICRGRYNSELCNSGKIRHSPGNPWFWPKMGWTWNQGNHEKCRFQSF